MTNCICLIQEGQIPEPVTHILGQGLKDIVVANQLGDDLGIAWIVIPKGQGWTAGEPSTSSVVTMTTPPIEQAHREQVLNQICDMWTDTTGCHINEIIATVMPTP